MIRPYRDEYQAVDTLYRQSFSIPVREIPDNLFLYVLNGQVVGCCALTTFADYPSVGLVGELAVHEDYRRRGIATRLIHHCTAHGRLKGKTRILLGTRAQHLKFYYGRGYRTVIGSRLPIFLRNLASTTHILEHQTSGHFQRR